MKKINAELIDSKTKQIERLVANALYIESIYLEDKEPLDIVKEAKNYLGLKEDDVITGNYQPLMENIYKEHVSFRRINNLLEDLRKQNSLTTEEEQSLVGVQLKLQEIISKRFNIEAEELYE